MATIIGVDGEGHDTPDGRHVYVYLCAANERGEVVSEAENPAGLSTEECVACLTRIPKSCVSFGFMFSYDVTKICRDLDVEDRYYLMRPDLRQKGRYPKVYRSKVRGFDYFAGSFMHYMWDDQKLKYVRNFYIWDCFKFFGTSFVKAIDAWQVGTAEQREHIADMKSKRGAFHKTDIADVKRYCQEECVLLAQMMRKVLTAHEKAGIKLTRYDGVGSTASALLRRERVTSYKNPKPWRREVEQALLAAYFGGRFENSRFGVVKKKCVSRDINSAYPFAQTTLPCLKHGKWSKTKSLGKVDKAQLALCKLSVLRTAYTAWMPLPCRKDDGTIVYGSDFSGWYHKSEALAALVGWPGSVRFEEALIYETSCDCDPFAWVREVYRQRLEWDSEGDGRGMVLKGGLNAGYGKLAQRIGGNPLFQSWCWAGAITAHTRSIMLGQIGPAAWDVLAIATDGYLAEDDGTRIGSEGKPLGAWEEKAIPEGVVLVKPGLYWRRNADEAAMRARGIGRRELYRHRKAIVNALEKGKPGVVVKSRRFFGAKSTARAYSYCADCEKTFPGTELCPVCEELPATTRFVEQKDKQGRDVVGTWALREINVDFAVTPKREAVMKNGRLRIVDLGGIVSVPYMGQLSPDAVVLKEGKELQLEQADWED